MATMAMSSEKKIMPRIITPPAMMGASRDLAPPLILTAVADIDPPTGIPWNTPAVMLPTPWPRKSPEGSGNFPSGLGMEELIAAPCTNPTKVKDKAGISRLGTAARSGIWGPGSDEGMLAMSETVGTDDQPSSGTMAVPTITATTMPMAPSRVLPKPTINATVTRPTVTVVHCH